MGMFAVKNDKGEYAHIDMDELTWETGFATLWFGANEQYAKRTADDYDGHVTELVEAPAKVVVSEAEAEMLEQAKCDDDPAELIVGFVNSHDKYDDDSKAEDRLMRAYVNGWTVEKPKWTKRDVVEAILLAKDTDTIWDSSTVRYYLNRYDDALPDCEKEEVTDDEQ